MYFYCYIPLIALYKYSFFNSNLMSEYEIRDECSTVHSLRSAAVSKMFFVNEM